MPFPVLGSNSAVAEFAIDNSLRFNDDDSPALQRTPASDSNEQTWTVSFWVKRSNITTSSSQIIFMTDTNLSEYIFARFCGTEVTGKADMFQVFMVEPNAREGNVRTARLFRDVSAYYHIVVRCDLTQSTAANRLRIYVNGVEETSFDTASYLNQNDDNINWNSNVKHAIGHQVTNTTTERYFDGYLAEFYNIDGQSLAPTEFGETNDNGVWIPKRFSGSYGTNGFKLEFKNSGALGTDTSGNGNNFTPTNLTATDQTTDTPTNNFCTFNPLDNDTVTGAATFSEGNTVINANSDAQSGCPSTIAVSNGKWYIEGKCLSSTFEIGVFGYGDGFSFNLANHPPYGDNGYPFAYEYGGSLFVNNSNVQSGLATFTTNDILAIALDMDNNTIKFFKNNTQVGSTITDSNLSNFAPYTFYVANHTGSNTNMFSLNTGNPAYTISSGNSDANGYGNFEYAVPSGYYALCTKNLAEYG